MPDPAVAKPIRSLLIANRGEIARRVIRTARAMGIVTVAVYSDADADSPHVAEANLAMRLPGVSPGDTYLRSDLLLEAALRSGADAVHPGYGFLSESGAFARATMDAGLVWVGPPPSAIDVMGSKIGAKELMRAAGVPTLPSITVGDHDTGDLDPEAVDALGWPLLVKASAGGGGRGMRIVAGPDELTDALSSARREAASAFGDGTVFLERYVVEPRHIEVQVLADVAGNTVALFERECSIQRRHQKIIEEAPSPVVGPAMRATLTDAAVAAARAVGYVNAGTVEFVVDRAGDPYFLEMNTRLQVEHPVTEAVTGLDLVRLQLLVASGATLPDEVHAAVAAGPQGHAIEARVYAEDPLSGWLPSTGTLHRFELRSGPCIRIDSGFESGGLVSPHYDPMLAKVIAHAATRDEAAAVLAMTLADADIHGVITNRDLLVRTLRHPAFRAGEIDTGFLDRHGLDELAAPLAGRDAVRRHAVAAALAAQAARRLTARVQPGVPSGWRNSAAQLQVTTFDSHHGAVTVAYRFDRTAGSLDRIEVTFEGEVEGGVGVDPRDPLRGAHRLADQPSAAPVSAAHLTPDAVTLIDGGVTRRYRVNRVGATSYVDGPDGSSALVEHDRFPLPESPLAPGASVAPMPGAVVRVAVAVGDAVSRGQLLVVLEAMKMEHAVHAATTGAVTRVHVSKGDQVETGQVLVVVDSGDGTAADGTAGGTAADGTAGGTAADGRAGGVP